MIGLKEMDVIAVFEEVSCQSMLDTNQGIVSQNEFKKIYRAKHAKFARAPFCHFDQREKSFLDPSHLLGMTCPEARHVGVLCVLCARYSDSVAA
jgi:hypothetical protein